MTTPDPTAVDTAPPAYDSQEVFTITKEVNLVQLADEIDAATGQSVQLALTFPAGGDALSPASDTNPATLSVSPGTVDQAKVQACIDAHSSIPGYDVPITEQNFLAVLQKLIDNPQASLASADMDAAIRGLVLRAVSPTSVTASTNPRRGV